MGARLRTRCLVGTIVAPAVFLSVSLVPSIAATIGSPGALAASRPARPARSTPFLTEEAPLRPLAAAFGFRISGSLRTGRVRICSQEHEIVVAPGIARALIDGRGVPLLTAPRFMGGEIVVPAELADIIRRMGGSGSSTGVPAGSRAAPRKKPKIAFLPTTTDHTMLLVAGGSSATSGGTDAPRGAGGAKGPRAAGSLGGGHVRTMKIRPETGKRGSTGTPGRAASSGHSRGPDRAASSGHSRGPDRAASSGHSRGPGRAGPAREAAGLVLVDAGHGGKDEGARGPKGTKEKDVVLLVAKALAEELGRQGVRVELTRADDTFVPLRSRAVTANRLKPDLFVSLHANSYPERDVRGIETWTAPKGSAAGGARETRRAAQSRALAARVQAALVRATGERDRGVRTGNLTVLRRTKVPAVLVEIGFLSNPKTEKRFAEAAYRGKLAKALAGAILGSGLLERREQTQN